MGTVLEVLSGTRGLVGGFVIGSWPSGRLRFDEARARAELSGTTRAMSTAARSTLQLASQSRASDSAW